MNKKLLAVNFYNSNQFTDVIVSSEPYRIETQEDNDVLFMATVSPLIRDGRKWTRIRLLFDHEVAEKSNDIHKAIFVMDCDSTKAFHAGGEDSKNFCEVKKLPGNKTIVLDVNVNIFSGEEQRFLLKFSHGVSEFLTFKNGKEKNVDIEKVPTLFITKNSITHLHFTEMIYPDVIDSTLRGRDVDKFKMSHIMSNKVAFLNYLLVFCEKEMISLVDKRIANLIKEIVGDDEYLIQWLKSQLQQRPFSSHQSQAI